MKLHFDSNQEYQIEAIRAITDISGESGTRLSNAITQHRQVGRGEMTIKFFPAKEDNLK
ncbi:MAG: hypothetical protein PHT49_10835 [Desulfovibrionales bacterium]|nr:hypothetical protein [Desulfovibrionales bacterium]